MAFEDLRDNMRKLVRRQVLEEVPLKKFGGGFRIVGIGITKEGKDSRETVAYLRGKRGQVSSNGT